jgi:hypothetical protein
LINNKIAKLSEKILQNRTRITWWEKRAKNLACIAVICFLFYQASDQINLENWIPAFPIKEMMSVGWIIDMEKEFYMLFASVGLYVSARTYNNYLDE